MISNSTMGWRSFQRWAKPPVQQLVLLVLHVWLLLVLHVVMLLVLHLLFLGQASAGTKLCWSEAFPPLLGGCQLAGR
jgi:hypothetical protein